MDANGTEWLETASLNQKLRWCNRDVILHDRGMGTTLVQYLDEAPTTWGYTGFWAQSSGGGQSIRADSIEEARVRFGEICAQRQRFWEERFACPGIMIVNSEAWFDGGHRSGSLSHVLGCGGRLFGLEEIATGRRCKTNNLWGSGKVPSEFMRLDTHRFVKPTEEMAVNQPTQPRLSVEQMSAIG